MDRTKDTPMKNSFLLIVLSLFITANISGCSLFSSSDEEQETATVAQEGAEASDASGGFASDDFASDDFASDDFESGDEFAKDDFESGTGFDAEAMASGGTEAAPEELVAGNTEVEDVFGDEYPDDDYGMGAEAAAPPAAATDTFANDTSFGAEDDALFMDEGGALPADPMSSNQETDLFAQEDTGPIVDTPAFGDPIGAPEAVYDVPSGFVPVKKMKPTAYNRSGANINRLYVVRPGDNMDSIAQKLYGSSSRAEDLYSYNSHFRGKTLDVGDKIYYESPNNKNDQSMMTYYEDNNLAPSYYTSQEGDNIRKISKKLLGHNRSWMEVWATNPNIESKGQLPGGLQIRYWPGDAATQTMAMDDPAPTPPPAAFVEDEMPEPEPVAMDTPENVPDFEDAGESLPVEEPVEVADINEPSMDDASKMDEDFAPPPAAGQVDIPPPPPPKAVAPPPPPPAPKSNFQKPAPPKMNMAKSGDGDSIAGVGDDNMIMGALGGLLILAAIIMLIFIRRSRAKRVNFSQTQV